MDTEIGLFCLLFKCCIILLCTLLLTNGENVTSPATVTSSVELKKSSTTTSPINGSTVLVDHSPSTQESPALSSEPETTTKVLSSTTTKTTTTTEIDHFDRAHPVNFTGIQTLPFSITITWVIVSQNDLDDLHGFNIHYYKSKYKHDPSKHVVLRVASNVTKMTLRNLKPGTDYSVYVVANYTSGHLPHTFTYHRRTEGYGENNPCNCSFIGSNRTVPCNSITGQCKCVDKYTTGKGCYECVKGYYWHIKTGCVKCPNCPKQRSRGSCGITDKHIVTCDCIGNYFGTECKYCVKDYFMSGETCKMCHCNNNTNSEQYRACDLYTGECVNCMYNTTGNYCEKCLPDYVGDPIIAKNCTYKDDVPRPSSSSGYSPVYQFFHDQLGAIVGILVSVVVLLIVIISVAVYRHWVKWKRRPLQFWTVQLKEDHERVSFSPDHPYHNVDALLLSDDVQFRIPEDSGYDQDPDDNSHRPKTRTLGGDAANPYQSLN